MNEFNRSEARGQNRFHLSFVIYLIFVIAGKIRFVLIDAPNLDCAAY